MTTAGTISLHFTFTQGFVQVGTPIREGFRAPSTAGVREILPAREERDMGMVAAAKPERRSPPSVGGAFLGSVLIGASFGICLQMALTTGFEGIGASELWVIPLLIMGYGMLAMPFVAFGLALFGLPLTRLLRSRSHRPWIGPIAIGWSAIAGKIVFYAIDHLLFAGSYDIARIERVDLGIIYGVPTGVAWWLLRRRAFANG